MKKMKTIILTGILYIAAAVPTYASGYSFSSGADTTETFGKPTAYDETVLSDPMAENIRRNKDAAYFPPPYGIFSGNIPTDQISLYHDNPAQYAGTLPAGMDSSYDSGVSLAGSTEYSGILTSTSLYASAAYHTLPLYYEDGSIGTLYIEKLNKTLKVYEGETLENMKKGIGHFESTSAWDGNACLAAHNRGTAAYFSFVKDLVSGDSMTYTTQYGTRTYQVYRKIKIEETDYSGLGWSAENIISMITCVENEPAYRWLVQAREVVKNP